MFTRGSRYAKVGDYEAVDAAGVRRLVKQIRTIAGGQPVVQHTVAEGERLDQIAYHYYRDTGKDWLILDANSALDPGELLRPGRRILIPAARLR